MKDNDLMLTAQNGTRFLFLDLQTVQSTHNVVQTVCQAVKHPDNPMLPLGQTMEWDARRASTWASRTVIYDEEDRIFKCWYDGGDAIKERWCATGYAISEDGINWIKPRLGLFDYDGNKNNNICNMGVGCVVKDRLEDDPNKRYKMVVKGYGGEHRPVRVNYSPDGIHWSEGPRISVSELVLNDVVVLLCDDEDPDPQRRFKLIWQVKHPPNKPGPPEVRAKSIAFGPDVEHFTVSEDNPFLSPNDGLEDEIHFLMLARYGGMYVMPYEYGWYAPNDTGVFGSFCGDIRLAVSRDGEHYQRVQPHQKLIARGQRGEWDDGFLVISDKPIIKDDMIYMYYAGNGEDWIEWPLENQPNATRESTRTACISRLGLATLRLDGFTCMQTTDRETPGSLTTQPIQLESSQMQLVLNAGDVQQGRSWIEVELLNAETDEVIEGFERTQCIDVSRDAVRVPVAWSNRALSQVNHSTIRLRFWLYGTARLYSFSFESA